MHLSGTILCIASLFYLKCVAASSFEEQEDAMFYAVFRGQFDILGQVLNDYQGDINEKIYDITVGDEDIMTNLLELAVFCHNPDMMLLIIEKKHPLIMPGRDQLKLSSFF